MSNKKLSAKIYWLWCQGEIKKHVFMIQINYNEQEREGRARAWKKIVSTHLFD